MSLRSIQSCRVLAAWFLLASGLSPLTAHAQFAWLRRDSMRFEIRPYAGVYLPTGAQRADIEGASVGGLQMSLGVVPRFAMTLTLGVAQSNDRIGATDRHVDIIQYDVGGEWRRPVWYRDGRYELAPFIGAGFGTRTYLYAARGDTVTTSTDGYATIGAELGVGLIGVRVEARDYVSRFASLATTGTGPTTRNDVTVSVGIAIRLGALGAPAANPPLAGR